MRISDWSSDVCSSDLGGPADRRAHVERVEPAQLLEVLLDEIGELQQQGLALERLHPAPRALEGAAGRCYGAVYVLGVALGDGGENLSGGGVVAFEGLAAGGVDPFPVDQHPPHAACEIGVIQRWASRRVGKGCCD